VVLVVVEKARMMAPDTVEEEQEVFSQVQISQQPPENPLQ
jgi:hypothetical protein